MQDKIDNLLNVAIVDINNCQTSSELTNIKVKYLGKNGEITSLLKSLKDVAPSEKPAMGKLLNDLRVTLDSKFVLKEVDFAKFEKDQRIIREAIDVTYMPINQPQIGSLHPLTLVKNDIINTFIGLGFEIKDGPEIEKDYYNFEALNIPKDHPARDMQDTFYITDNFLLRSQTSAVQVHTMETHKPPIRIICPGKVYRSDSDASHSPMFQQIEGLVIDENISMCDLQGVLNEFAKSFFSPTTKIRLRPSYFPFTEPSVEVDLSCTICGGKGCRLCKGTGWIELLGAGIVNPAVLECSGIDSKVYKGFAFGLGVDRAAMVKYGIPDLRIMFENDVRYLKQYK